MKTDTSDRRLENLIVTAMTGSGEPPPPDEELEDRPGPEGTGWLHGRTSDYDREYAVDVGQLLAFLMSTQPQAASALSLDEEGPSRRKFLARLQGEITKRGVIGVIRDGVKHGPVHVDLFYGTPSPGNVRAAERHAANRFSVTRQLRDSRDQTHLALDLALFINGLPIATFELKNNLTKQTLDDAVQRFRRDREPRELLFQFGRCVAHCWPRREACCPNSFSK